jgi:hypothetical protein
MTAASAHSPFRPGESRTGAAVPYRMIADEVAGVPFAGAGSKVKVANACPVKAGEKPPPSGANIFA